MVRQLAMSGIGRGYLVDKNPDFAKWLAEVHGLYFIHDIDPFGKAVDWLEYYNNGYTPAAAFYDAFGIGVSV